MAMFGDVDPNRATWYNTMVNSNQQSTSQSNNNQNNQLGSFDSSMNGEQVRNLANQYITTGGAKNIDNGQYWVDRWNEWGSKDPNYFMTRLKQGVNDNAGKNFYSDVGFTPGNSNDANTAQQQATPQNVTWAGTQATRPNYGFYSGQQPTSRTLYGNQQPYGADQQQLSSLNPSNYNDQNNYTQGLKSLGYGG